MAELQVQLSIMDF